tara:strand:- start:3525 stop:4256 length:732 start_codon:yes stop_codon:yes gene_type:complete
MISLVTGGFDPVHSGHIALFKGARSVSDRLIVGVNSDQWLIRKKGKYFMPIEERINILKNLSMVDEVITFNDEDDTACDAIERLLPSNDDIVFCNGGDRGNNNTPELFKYVDKVTFAWGVGGVDKKNSSSWLLADWSAPKTKRAWGHYKVLYEGKGFKVKELVINPKSSLSMQRHKNRSETWNIVTGNAHVIVGDDMYKLSTEKGVYIPPNTWHKGINESDEEAHIIEVWRGDILTEEDIERQ